MTTMGGDHEPITGREGDDFIWLLEPQGGAAAEQRHPFIAILIVPLAHGRGVPARHDALELERFLLNERVEDLIGASIAGRLEMWLSATSVDGN